MVVEHSLCVIDNNKNNNKHAKHRITLQLIALPAQDITNTSNGLT